MNRFTLSMVMTAALGLAAYSFSGAQVPGPGGDRRGPGPGQPGVGAGFSALRGADLTEEQRTEIRALREAERAGGPGGSAVFQLHRALEAELFAEVPDDQKIEQLRQQVLDAHGARLAKEIELSRKVAQVLTAEQRAKVRERLTAPAPNRAPGAPEGRRSRRG